MYLPLQQGATKVVSPGGSVKYGLDPRKQYFNLVKASDGQLAIVDIQVPIYRTIKYQAVINIVIYTNKLGIILLLDIFTEMSCVLGMTFLKHCIHPPIPQLLASPETPRFPWPTFRERLCPIQIPVSTRPAAPLLP